MYPGAFPSGQLYSAESEQLPSGPVMSTRPAADGIQLDDSGPIACACVCCGHRDRDRTAAVGRDRPGIGYFEAGERKCGVVHSRSQAEKRPCGHPGRVCAGPTSVIGNVAGARVEEWQVGWIGWGDHRHPPSGSGRRQIATSRTHRHKMRMLTCGQPNVTLTGPKDALIPTRAVTVFGGGQLTNPCRRRGVPVRSARITGRSGRSDERSRRMNALIVPTPVTGPAQSGRVASSVSRATTTSTSSSYVVATSSSSFTAPFSP